MRHGLRYLRIAFFLIGFAMLALAAGFVYQSPWAIWLWPWPDGRLSYLFIGAIAAAIAAAFLSIGWTAEWGALAAGAVNVLITASGMATFLWWRIAESAQTQLSGAATTATLTALFAASSWWWSRQRPIRDAQPIPWPVRGAFVVFVIALLLAGAALLWQLPHVMPWPLTPDSSVMFGWIFIGDAFYFIPALLYPRWYNARAQLWSFLAYDLVMLPALLARLPTVPGEDLLSLSVYLAVLLGSGTLAIYYLLINRATRTSNSPIAAVYSDEQNH